MFDSENPLIHQTSDIAELNSLFLDDYESSFEKYYNKENRSSFSSKFFKWFEHSKFEKTNNSFLNDFEDLFL